ncbi:MAG: hypothetical protein WBG73_11620 [Coleofasciculaceae cyanobacterium]
MSSNDFLEIRYDAFIYNDGVEELEGIDDFKKGINENYNNIVKATPVGRGGGAYEFVIHFICDLPLQDYIKIIIGYLGVKIVNKSTDKLLEKYLFVPLQSNYQKLKKNNSSLDCYSFQMEFKDVNIFIYKTSDNSIFSNLNKILQQISKHIKNIEKIEEHKTTSIHIPAILDIVNGHKVYRAPLGEEETKNLSVKDYFSFWGIEYCANQLSVVYDLNSKSILSDYRFYTEKNFQAHCKLD